MLPKAHIYYKIAVFLVNQFGKRCVSKVSTDKKVLEQIRIQDTKENMLAIKAETGRWSKRKIPFKKLTSANVLNFPDMSENDLHIFFHRIL